MALPRKRHGNYTPLNLTPEEFQNYRDKGLTLQQIADLLFISEDKLYTWRKEKGLVKIRLNRRTFS